MNTVNLVNFGDQENGKKPLTEQWIMLIIYTVCPRKNATLDKWHFYLNYYVLSKILTIGGCWPLIFIPSYQFLCRNDV